MQANPPPFTVALINLGTPARPDRAAVRSYLKTFLSDRRVVDLPRWLWWLILNGIILNVRPGRVAKLYKSVWMDEGSPLMVHSRRLAATVDPTGHGGTRHPAGGARRLETTSARQAGNFKGQAP